jgi:hypothetical protein
MGPLTTNPGFAPQPAKVSQDSFEQQSKLIQLSKMLDKRDQVVARNNAIAAVDPKFAATLMTARQDGLDQQADAAVAKVENALLQQQPPQPRPKPTQGMDGWEIAAIGSVFVTVLVGAISVIYWQTAREERAFAEANPFQATFSTATNMVFWVVAGGAVVLGGLVYWDYRQRKDALYSGYTPPELPSRAGERPFERSEERDSKSGEKFRGDMKKLKRDIGKLFAKKPKVSKKDLTKTLVDTGIDKRFAKEFAEDVKRVKEEETEAAAMREVDRLAARLRAEDRRAAGADRPAQQRRRAPMRGFAPGGVR